VETAIALNVPELAPICCDIYLTGYAGIAGAVNTEFRRPYSKAKGR